MLPASAIPKAGLYRSGRSDNSLTGKHTCWLAVCLTAALLVCSAGNYIFPPENELVYRSRDSCFAIKETGRQDKYAIYSFKVRLTSGFDAGSCEIYIPDEVFPVIIIPQSSNWDQFRSEEVRAMAISGFEGDAVLVQFHDGISNILSMQLAGAAKCFRGVISDTDDEMLKALARKNLKEVRRLRR